jgi:hypothetical protein
MVNLFLSCAQTRNRTSEFASPIKRQSMTIIDRLLRACATGRGWRLSTLGTSLVSFGTSLARG